MMKFPKMVKKYIQKEEFHGARKLFGTKEFRRVKESQGTKDFRRSGGFHEFHAFQRCMVWVLAVTLAVTTELQLITTGPQVVFASSLSDIQQLQDETQDQIDDIESQKSEAESAVSDLQDEADALEDELSSYTAQLDAVNEKIESTKAAIDSATASISELQTELEEAQAATDEQYESMKQRIAYMYEHFSGMSVLESLLESGSFSEFLNRVEYISSVMEYDRQMLASYQELQETIISKTEELEQTQSDLATYQSSLSDSQDEMNDLVVNASSAVSAKNSEVDAAQSTVDDYDSQLETLHTKMQSLQSQADAAQAALAQQIAEQQKAEEESGTVEDTSAAYSSSEYEVLLLAATIQAEAWGEGYTGQKAVGTVIMNRVQSSKFPDTIYGVVTQTNQFASWSSGMVQKYLEKGPDSQCISVAQECINGARLGDWLFFMTPSAVAKYPEVTGYTTIGNHVFFKIWGAN